MGKNQEYAAKYAEEAKEQMRRYGIPASVILAQAILESSSGQSQLALNENNHFGIKATKEWLESGGRYGLYNDDKPNEKFCSYDSVGESYEHHSRFLKDNPRYAKCFTLSPDDYRGWSEAIAQAGYATGGRYAQSIQSIIERNGLDKYDREVMAEMKALGKEFGVTAKEEALYSFPVKRDEFLLVTAQFGMQNGGGQMQKGIDISCKSDAVLATENHGRVIAAGSQSVTVEYLREDGTKLQCTYRGLTSTDAKVGDMVSAGQKLGITGDTLAFGVRQVSLDGSTRDIDPAAYLSDISVKGSINLKLLSDGQDLLAKYKTPEQRQEADMMDMKMSPEDWMKKLLSSEDSGVGMSMGDPIMELVMTMFSSLMALATQLDNKNREEQMEAATEAAVKSRVDLSSLTPSLTSCTLSVTEYGRPILEMEQGKDVFRHELDMVEVSQIRNTLSAEDLSDERKMQAVSSLVNRLMVSERLSQNYEQGLKAGEEQVNTLQR